MPTTPPTQIAFIDKSFDTWRPTYGLELARLLKNTFKNPEDPLDQADREEVERSTLEILEKCVRPGVGEPEHRTGLIVGYVQSGKTLSFTSVMAAARDNHYRLVILLAGSSRNLHEQNTERLEGDLYGKGGHTRPWKIVHAEKGKINQDEIDNVLHGWTVNQEIAQTIVISILKEARNIKKIAHLLSRIPPEAIGTVLVIDDEADYASLNTHAKKPLKAPSSTNATIYELRSVLKRHTYLQYTATPQANIFVHLGDPLSPDFCQVLKPGSRYLGGKHFFQEEPNRVATIDDDELPGHYTEEEIPESLLAALREFLLGVAIGLLRNDDTNRSMMVHPANSLEEHDRYKQDWIDPVLSGWWEEFREIDGPDWREFIAPFEKAYQKLCQNSRTPLPEFSELLPFFPLLQQKCEVKLLNKDEVIKKKQWKAQYAWILVGGYKLDRGLTVEGLTVTYIPRSPGQKHADTLQQRARFFGYKQSYEDLIRIHMPNDVKKLFKNYVDSEESMRAFLAAHSGLGALKSPKLIRRFQMDREMKPCRTNIIYDYPKKRGLSWFNQKDPLANLREHIPDNLKIIDKFVQQNAIERVTQRTKCEWLTDESDVTPGRLHEVIGPIPLEDLYKGLLLEIGTGIKGETDFVDWSLSCELIRHYIDREQKKGAQERVDTNAFIIKIAPEYKKRTGERQYRELNNDDRIKTIQAGPSAGYKGENSVKRGILTLQVYELDLIRRTRETIPAVTTLRLWLGSSITKSFIEQHYFD